MRSSRTPPRLRATGRQSPIGADLFAARIIKPALTDLHGRNDPFRTTGPVTSLITFGRSSKSVELNRLTRSFLTALRAAGSGEVNNECAATIAGPVNKLNPRDSACREAELASPGRFSTVADLPA